MLNKKDYFRHIYPYVLLKTMTMMMIFSEAEDEGDVIVKRTVTQTNAAVGGE